MDKKIRYSILLVGCLFTILMASCKPNSEEPLPKPPVNISVKDTIHELVVDSVEIDTIVTEKEKAVVKVKPKKKYKPRKRKKEVPTVFPTVVYHEFFKNEDPREHGFVLDVNGKRHIMRIGEVIGEMELVKGDAGSVTLFFKTQRRRIAIKK